MLPDGSLLKSFPKMYASEQESQSVQPISSARSLFMLGKLFQQGTIAKHFVRKIKSVVDEILSRRNLLLSDKIAE